MLLPHTLSAVALPDGLKTSLSGHGSRTRATPAVRPRPVHMVWDREV